MIQVPQKRLSKFAVSRKAWGAFKNTDALMPLSLVWRGGKRWVVPP